MFTTTYIVEVTDMNSCVNTDSVNILVNPIPLGILMNDTTICEGDTLILHGDIGINYSWASGTYLSCDTCQSAIIFPQANTEVIMEMQNKKEETNQR